MSGPEVTFAQVTELPATWTGAVRPEYLDHNGHMNIERYFEVHRRGLAVLFDERFAVDDAYRRKHGMGLFTVEQHLRYLSETVADEQLSLRLRVLARSAKTVHLLSHLVNTNRRQVANTLELAAVHVNPGTRRATPFMPDLARTIDGEIADGAALAWTSPTCGVIGPRPAGNSADQSAAVNNRFK